MMRIRHLICFLLFGCGTCLGQSVYLGMTPGVSKRADIEKNLGPPLRAAGRTSQYPAPAGSESDVAKIEVQFQTDSDIAERIEVYFPSALDRSAMIRSLGLAEQPESTKEMQGKLVEYFGSPAWLALTYAAGKQSDGVNSLGFYSPDLFRSMAGKPAAKSSAGDSPQTKAASDSTPSSPATKSLVGDSAQAKPSNDSTPGSSNGASTGTTTSSGRSDNSTANSYKGPSSGTIVWSGPVDADEVITIEGDHSTKGSVSGALPGVPVQVDLDAKEFAIVDGPAPSNGWKRLAIRSKRKRQAVISIHWSVLQ